jgi:hypothetical protein
MTFSHRRKPGLIPDSMIARTMFPLLSLADALSQG